MYKNHFPIITEDSAKLPFYITSIGYNDKQDNVDRPEGYPSYHWLHCTAGKGILEIGGNEHIIPESTGFILNPGVAHKYYALTGVWETKWLTFDGYAVQRLLKQLNIGSRYTVFEIHDIKRLEKFFNEIFFAGDPSNINNNIDGAKDNVFISSSWQQNNICSYLLYKFLIELNSCIYNNKERLKTEKRFQLEPVLIYMKNNFNQNCSLEDYANIINITPQHLCRLFSQAFNMRPFEYLTGIRLQKAKLLLAGQSCLKLSEIARKSGFNDTSYFCAVFKKHEGITPVDFRKLHGIKR